MSDGNSMFIRQADQRRDAEFQGDFRLLKNPAYKRFVREFTSEHPEEYEDGRSVNGQAGTVLPVATRKGMIHNDPNPYGKVVVGSVIGDDGIPPKPLDIKVLEDRVAERRQTMVESKRKRGEMLSKGSKTMKVELPNTIEALEEMLPSLEGHVLNLAVHKLSKLLERRNAESEDKEETADLDAQSAAFQEELEQLEALADEDEESEMKDGVFYSEDEVEQVPVEVSEPISTVASSNTVQSRPLFDKPMRVKMDGSFGRSSTRFLAVERHADQLILVYDPEENIFVPAANGEPFNLNYNNQMLQVSNVGIEFELDFLGVGVLVFIIKEQ